MFPQFKKLKNESGVVLFVILMAVILIMIYAVGILTQNMNETNYAQHEVDQIVSDQLAKGLFWNAYSTAYESGNITNLANLAYSNVLNGRDYSVQFNSFTCTGGLPCYNGQANYDTFE